MVTNFMFYPKRKETRWIEAITPIHDEWVADMESKGYSNAREILEEAIRLGKEFPEK